MLDKLTDFQKIDIFGVAPNIRFRGKDKSYSLYGFIYTLMIWGFILWAIIFTSQDLVHRTDPSLLTTTLQGATARENIALSHDVFQLGFGLYDNSIGNYFIDSTIYTVEANLGTYVLQPDGSAVLVQTSLDIRPCQASDFDNNVDYYQSQWCFSKHQTNLDKTISVRTKADSFINILFKVCDGTVAGTTCASTTDINTVLARSYFMTTYKQTTVDPSSYSNPLSDVYPDNWKGVLLGKSKEIQLKLDVIEFNSDNGWLFESKKSQRALNFNEITADVLEVQTTGSFVTFLIANSGNKIVYNRSYMKVQDVLAQVSGLGSTVILVLGFLAFRYAELQMYEKTINDIYQIKIIDHHLKNIRFGEKKDPDFKPSGLRIFPVKREKKIELTESALALDQNSFENPQRAPKNSIGSPEKINNMKDSSVLKEENNDESVIELVKIKNDTSQEIPSQKKNTVKPHPSIETKKEDFVMLDHQALAKKSESGESINIHINYFEWLISPFKSQPKLKLLKRGQEEVEKCLDLLTLVKKIKEIDKLKSCLMSPEQRIIFENLKQPVLSIDMTPREEIGIGGGEKQKMQAQIKDWSDFSSKEDALTPEEAYKTLKESHHKSHLSQKLLKLYENDRKMN